MFKEFWEQKKHLILFTSAIIAITALFLAVPKPEDNETALSALLNIQFFWLLILSIILLPIFLNVLLFVTSVESAFTKKHQISFGSTFSALGFFGFVYFLYNLWKFMYASYPTQLHTFLSSTEIIVAIIIFAFAALPFKRFFKKKEELHITHLKVYLVVLAAAFINAFWHILVQQSFTWFDYLNALLWNFVIYSVAFYPTIYFRKKYLKKEPKFFQFN